jgi:hypothetical protein
MASRPPDGGWFVLFVVTHAPRDHGAQARRDQRPPRDPLFSWIGEPSVAYIGVEHRHDLLGGDQYLHEQPVEVIQPLLALLDFLFREILARRSCCLLRGWRPCAVWS